MATDALPPVALTPKAAWAWVAFALAILVIVVLGAVLVEIARRKRWISTGPVDALVNRLAPATAEGTPPAAS